MTEKHLSLDPISLFEFSPDACFITNEDGFIIEANSAAEALLRRSRREIAGTAISHFFNDLQKVNTCFQTALSNGLVREDELQLVLPDGQFMPVSLHGTVCAVNEAPAGCLYIALRDISEQKRLEANLQENERLYRTIADSSSNWSYWINAEGKLVFVSRACENITGYARHEFLSNPGLFSTILHPEDRAALSFHINEQTDQLQLSPIEFRIVTKKKEVRWILHTCQPLFSSNGTFVGRWVINQDITQRKQSDLEHIRAEKRLSQLTHQLITIQETERTRISQDLHDDIGQGMTDLLLRINAIYTSVSPEKDDLRGQIFEAVESVEALINQVRQLAHQLRPPSLDSVPLSKALESLCSSFAQLSAIHVDYSSDKDLPPIPGLQATALYRLVQEGLNNAHKHANASAMWINLDYVDGEVSISLEDNGKGFVYNSSQNGMGLWGLQERFRLLNGGLEIESAPGKGTRLYGFLPLANHNL